MDPRQFVKNSNIQIQRTNPVQMAPPMRVVTRPNIQPQGSVKINTSLRSQAEPDYVDEILNFADEKEIGDSHSQGDKDELYQQALEIIRSEGKASTSFLQRKLQIGYNRAARIIDMMEADGIVSKANHVGKRDVL